MLVNGYTRVHPDHIPRRNQGHSLLCCLLFCPVDSYFPNSKNLLPASISYNQPHLGVFASSRFDTVGISTLGEDIIFAKSSTLETNSIHQFTFRTGHLIDHSIYSPSLSSNSPSPPNWFLNSNFKPLPIFQSSTFKDICSSLATQPHFVQITGTFCSVPEN
jgi:hypothetical protein